METVSSDGINRDIINKLISDCEDELVVSLGRVDLLDKLTNYEVFNKTFVQQRVSSLKYDHLDTTLVIRYVLQLVGIAWECDQSVWNKFLNMLQSVGGRAGIIAVKLRSQSTPEKVTLVETNMSDIVIQEHHINSIMSVLAECADKWEQLCVTLDLNHKIIEADCRNNGINYAIMRLIYVLEERIKKHPPLTLRTLAQSLRSSLVRCASAADKLEREFEPFAGVSPSCQTPYGRSMLLGAGQYQASSYQWMKNGERLRECHQFDGVDKSVLYVNEVTDSDRYTCHMQNGNSTHIKEICLEVLLPKKSSFLVNLFSHYEPSQATTWPPVSSSTFITLALVQQNKKPEVSIVSVARSIDDILEDKVVTKYDDIFKYYKKRTLLFIEGRPGSGKTTLVFKVANDWANSKALKGASRVCIIPLRMLNFHKIKSLQDLFSLIYQYCECNIEKEIQQIQTNHGESVCFILDGLDEYNDRKERNSIILKLIYKQILPEAMVIVASRPIGTAELRKTAPVQKRIEVLGFTSENVWRYIENYPFCCNCGSSKLITYLKLHMNVLYMCYLPVHASMVCYLYDDLGDEIPCIETKMYEYFTALTILRKLKREGKQKIKFDGLHSLDKEHRQYFDKICALAFDMAIKNVQVIKKGESEFSVDQDPVGSDGPSLGLITIDSAAHKYGYKDIYVFLHLTFQEYLAARYLSQLSFEKHRVSIDKLRKSKQIQILKFYCGLAGANFDSVNFKKIAYYEIPEDPYLFECAFESQNTEACNIVLSYSDDCSKEKAINDLCLGNFFFHPSDFNAIAYVLSESNLRITTLKLRHTSFEEEGIQAFLNSVDHKKLLFITTFEITNEYHPLPIRSINILLKELHYLQHLILGRKVLCADDLANLTQGVILDNLQDLHIFVELTNSKVLETLTFRSSKLVKIYFGCDEIRVWNECEG